MMNLIVVDSSLQKKKKAFKGLVCRIQWHLVVWMQIATNRTCCTLPSPSLVTKNVMKSKQALS